MTDMELAILYRDLHKACRDYIKFLDKKSTAIAPFLYIHGWKCEESVEKEEDEKRQKIRNLEEKINNSIKEEITKRNQKISQIYNID